MPDTESHALRTDAETWKRFRVAAVTAGLSTGKFLGVLLDQWEASQRAATLAAGARARMEELVSGAYLEETGAKLSPEYQSVHDARLRTKLWGATS